MIGQKIARFFCPSVFTQFEQNVAGLKAENLLCETRIRELLEENEALNIKVEEFEKKVDSLVEERAASQDLVNLYSEANAQYKAEVETLTDIIETYDAMTAEQMRAKYDALRSEESQPWSMFEVTSNMTDDQVQVQFHWNPAFIQMISALGFTDAETDEERVEQFFTVVKMGPSSLFEPN